MDSNLTHSFRYRHGKKTYLMAWVVEICLFLMGISLAGFNIIFGLQSGDILSGILLAIGWVILGVIELATIPMAGSLRMAGRRYVAFAAAGTVGLLFLSAFTVYEFNEIASEYMTRGARQAAVKVDTLKKSIMDYQAEIVRLDGLAREAQTEISASIAERARENDEEQIRYRLAVEKIDGYYGELLAEMSQADASHLNEGEKHLIQRHQLDAARAQEEIEALRKSRTEMLERLREEHRLRIGPQRERIEGRIDDIDSQIMQISLDTKERTAGATRGWIRSKESVVGEIQAEGQAKVTALREEKDTLRTELASVLEPHLATREIEAMDVQSIEAQARVLSARDAISRIEGEAVRRLDTPEFRAVLEGRQGSIDRISSDRRASLDDALQQHRANLEKIEAKFASRDVAISEKSISEAERISRKEMLNSQVSAVATEIREVIQETSSEYEKTMYYRMASWFSDEDHTGFGKLPRKEDYNKALSHIFAPIGLFFGLAAISLAYIGTGFMYDAEREGKKAMAGLDSEDDRADKEVIRELKSRLRNQVVLEKRVTEMKRTIEKQEDDLIKAKARTFEAVKRVPQTIVLNGETNGEHQL